MTTLSPSQQRVIDHFPDFLLNDEPEMTISGFAGSGKSFLVEYLADMGEKQQKLVKLIDPRIKMRKMKFTATTNKAAEVLRGFLHREANTIHKTLGLKVVSDYKTGKVNLVEKSSGELTSHTLLFIDEASMINRELLHYIRHRAKSIQDVKVIYIGDSYQLPPVKEDKCPVFNNGPNTFDLVEIQRQVADSPIIQLSAEYRHCLDDPTKDWPDPRNYGDGVTYYENKEDFFKVIEQRFTGRPAFNQYKILGWANNRIRDYNNWIRKMQGRVAQFEVGETLVANKPLFEGRNLVASTDSYHTVREVIPAARDGIAGFNIHLEDFGGNLSFFTPADWNKADKLAKMYATDKAWGDYFEIKERWADLRPVHASTVHKSQGSTYDEVFVDLNNIGKCTRWKDVARLVYVAVTRARNRVHIYGSLDGNYNKQASVDIMEAFQNVKCL